MRSSNHDRRIVEMHCSTVPADKHTDTEPKVALGGRKHRLALFRSKTQHGQTVDAEHQRLHGRSDSAQVANRFYDAPLHGGNMSDLEQWIYVGQVNLPELEDLYWIRV